MNIYEARWNNALKWAKKVKEHFDTGNCMIKWDVDFKYMIKYGDDFYPNEYDFVIDEVNRLISIKSKDETIMNMIYEYDLDWDHGSYTTIAETNKLFSEINLYSVVKVKL